MAAPSGDHGLTELGAPLAIDDLAAPAGAPWEVEIGFGKGRYLLQQSRGQPRRRFLGIEQVAEYHRMLVARARRQGLGNWLALRGEALYLLAAVLPRGFAAAVHVYFPDPWPKTRHHKRRLFDPETVDLVIGLLRPGGRLDFATDFLAYGELVKELLAGCPGVTVRRREEPWEDGPRTNYEAKYALAGRPILRLEACLETPPSLHPAGREAVLAAVGGAGTPAEPAAAAVAPEAPTAAVD